MTSLKPILNDIMEGFLEYWINYNYLTHHPAYTRSSFLDYKEEWLGDEFDDYEVENDICDHEEHHDRLWCGSREFPCCKCKNLVDIEGLWHKDPRGYDNICMECA